MENIELNFNNLKVDQLGFVYKDVEKQAKILEKIFNIPKFAIIPPFSNVVKYRGKEATYTSKIAISRQFNIQFELIEHIEGESLYKEFLDQRKEGLHHISLFVDKIDPYIEYFNEKGYDVIFLGTIGKQFWAYFDTEKTLGLFLEVQETKNKRSKKN